MTLMSVGDVLSRDSCGEALGTAENKKQIQIYKTVVVSNDKLYTMHKYYALQRLVYEFHTVILSSSIGV